jgi:hypothetical protein
MSNFVRTAAAVAVEAMDIQSSVKLRRVDCLTLKCKYYDPPKRQ